MSKMLSKEIEIPSISLRTGKKIGQKQIFRQILGIFGDFIDRYLCISDILYYICDQNLHLYVRMKARYLFIFCCLLACLMQAQTHYLFQRFNVSHGLSSNYVNDLTQDRMGCIWIASEGGVTRFDGSRMKSFTSSNSLLPNNEVSTILADTARNQVWVGTRRGGLCLFDASTYSMELFTAEQGMLENHVCHLEMAADGGVWVTHRTGIDHLNPDTRQFERLTYASGKELEGEFNCVIDDHNGHLYVGTRASGLSIVDLQKQTVTNFRHREGDASSLPHDQVLCLFIDRSGRVWVGTSNGLALFHPQSGTFTAFLTGTHSDQRLLGNQVNDIGQSTDGTLWVCTHRGGVNTLNINDYSFNSEEEIYFNTIGFTGDLHGLSSPNARCFLQDSFGNIWIGNYRGGVDFISYERPPFQTLDYRLLRDGNYLTAQVWGLTLDNQGRIWMGGENELVAIDESGRKQTVSFQGIAQPLTHASVLYKDSKGLIWVGLHQDGVLTFQPQTNRLTRIPMPDPMTDVVCFSEDPDGSMWIGTQTGIFRWQQGGVVRRDILFNKQLHNQAVHGIIIDAQGNYWIGSFEYGLLKFNHQHQLVCRFDESNGLGDKAINTLYLDRQGGLWVGHRSGLSYIADTSHPQVENYGDAQGLNNLNVRAITSDLRGNIWVSTNAGLSQWDAQRRLFYNYNHLQGVPLGDFMDGSVCADARGRLFFGSQNGACYFNPSEINHSQAVIPVSITEFRVYKNSSSPDHNDYVIPFDGRSVSLDYQQNTFRITFNVMDYTLGRQAVYEYQMEGLGRNRFLLDEEHQVTFRDLEPGRYTFKVRARLRNQKWNDSFTTLRIIIHPPLWLTWYAKLFYLLLGCGMLYGTLLFYKRRIDLENRLELEHQRLENNQQLHNERLRFFTNITHELRTPLTLILGPLEDLLADSTLSPRHANKISIIRDSATRLLNLINQILEFRKTETQNRKLLISHCDLGGLAREIGSLFQELNRNEKVEVIVDVPDTPTELYFDREVLTIIINNLLSNAMKYTEEGRIILRIDRLTKGTQRYTRLQVSDTGYGIAPEALNQIFQRYYQEGGAHQASGSGIGLALVKSLVDLHEGVITAESTPGQGSTFTLLLLTDNTYPHARHEELPPAQPQVEKKTTAESEPESPKPLLLVVEDNKELCAYLRSSFEDNWQVITASNGQEGWELAQERIPNLIVSDIMMPVMDGIAFCRLLKGDIRTSHIPLILLTAKGSISDKEEGYAAGADSFITKPFSARLLQLRMENLLANRSKLASLITAVATEEGADVSSVEVASDNSGSQTLRTEGNEEPRLTQLDQFFLDKVKSIIVENLSMEKMDVAFIADKMCMSHSTLYRKIKGLTNMTVNEFVRKLKMQASLDLLRKGEHSIAEISDRTGFSSVTYFRQCFKDEFGMSPSEYVKRMNTGGGKE